MSKKVEDILEFPCNFSVKAIGKAEEDFISDLFDLVKAQVPEITEKSYKENSSKGGKYTSVTFTFKAQNMEQINRVYSSLGGHKSVMMCL